MMAVSPLDSSHSCSRCTSRRRAAASGSSARRMSSASKTMRRAAMAFACAPNTASIPLRSKSPACIRSGAGCASRKNSLFLVCRSATFQLKPSRFATMRFGLSSKATNMPGSLKSRAPCTRNCSAKMVLPDPAPPASSVDRPWGKPPPVSSSNPTMPLGVFFSAEAANKGVVFMGEPEEGYGLRDAYATGAYTYGWPHPATKSRVPTDYSNLTLRKRFPCRRFPQCPTLIERIHPVMRVFGSIVRFTQLRAQQPHASILKLQAELESLEPRRQARFLPSIHQRTLRFRNRLLPQFGPCCDGRAKAFIFLRYVPSQLIQSRGADLTGEFEFRTAKLRVEHRTLDFEPGYSLQVLGKPDPLQGVD